MLLHCGGKKGKKNCFVFISYFCFLIIYLYNTRLDLTRSATLVC